MAEQLVPPRPKLVPIETRLKAKIARHRTVELAVAPPLDTRLTVSVEDAGRLLGIGTDAAYRELHAGRLPAIKVGRLHYVPMQGIAEIIVDILFEITNLQPVAVSCHPGTARTIPVAPVARNPGPGRPASIVLAGEAMRDPADSVVLRLSLVHHPHPDALVRDADAQDLETAFDFVIDTLHAAGYAELEWSPPPGAPYRFRRQLPDKTIEIALCRSADASARNALRNVLHFDESGDGPGERRMAVRQHQHERSGGL